MRNIPQRKNPPASRGRRLLGRTAAAWLGGLGVVAVQGQDLVTPPSGGGGSSAFPDGGVLQKSGIYQAPPLAPNTLPPLVHWGELTLRPDLVYRFLLGDGLPVSTNRSYSTVIQEFSPGILLGLGPYWDLRYTPTERLYSNHNFVDGLDHYVNLQGNVTNRATTLTLKQAYSHTTAPLLETGGQTEVDNYDTRLRAVHLFNGELSLDVGVSQYFRFTSQYQSYRDWSTLDWLAYQVTPRLNLAMGLGMGYSAAINSANSLYEQAQGRMNLQLTDRLSLGLYGGVEEREVLSKGGGNLFNPIFGASILFAPGHDTVISLGASRVTSVSYTAGNLNETTAVELSLVQQLLERVSLRLIGGYQQVAYVNELRFAISGGGIVDFGSVVRKDDAYLLTAQVIYAFSKRGTLALLYRYSNNKSSEQGYALTSNQVGIELGYHY